MDLGNWHTTRFGSRSLLILAGTGAAVGFSNLLNFPILVGLHGGGAFLLVYLLCKFLVAIPVVMAEMALGRRTRMSPTHGMDVLIADNLTDSRWRWLGRIMMIAGLMTLAVSSVVFSWAMAYLTQIANHPTPEVEGFYFDFFLEVINQSERLGFYQVLFVLMLVLVVGSGFVRGIERAVLLLVPALLVTALILGVVSIGEDRWGAAVEMIFAPRWHQLTWTSLLAAMQHAFFTLGVGVGAIWAYSSYMDQKQSIGRCGIAIAMLDLAVSVLMAMFLWSNILGNELSVSTGAGLLFQALPDVIPGSWSIVFFLFMVLSGLTSAIFLMEAPVQWLVERHGIRRLKAALIIAGGVLCLGLLGQFSFNLLSEVRWYGRTFFENLVFISSGVLVPVAGFLTALFVGWVMKPGEVVDEIHPSHPVRYGIWRFSLRFISIAAIGLVFFAAIEQYLGLQISMSLTIFLSLVVLMLGLRKMYQEGR